MRSATVPGCRGQGGLFGAIFIGVAILMVPRLGAATVFALIVMGQMIGSVAFDHFRFARFAATFSRSTLTDGGGSARLRCDFDQDLIRMMRYEDSYPFRHACRPRRLA